MLLNVSQCLYSTLKWEPEVSYPKSFLDLKKTFISFVGLKNIFPLCTTVFMKYIYKCFHIYWMEVISFFFAFLSLEEKHSYVPDWCVNKITEFWGLFCYKIFITKTQIYLLAIIYFSLDCYIFSFCYRCLGDRHIFSPFIPLHLHS